MKTTHKLALFAAFSLTALPAYSAEETQTPAAPPPLPFHTIEGYGGGAITPIAYLVNPATDDSIFGLPSFAASYVTAGEKNLLALTLTETLWGRLELGYGYDEFGIGTLDDDILAATGVDIGRSNVKLQVLNARVLLIKEGSFDAPLPAITFGVHFKKNTGIDEIDGKLGGALTSIGLDDDSGVEYTLTASKSFAPGGTPVIVSAGLRNSSAAHLGLLGFADERTTTFEGNIVVIPSSWLLLAYEYRQKGDPYGIIPGLVGREDDWHAIDASWLINSHATLVVGWGAFGTLANTKENSAWYAQLKYEF
ncbi:MAG TPA: DUF3034 family protein [Opitutales bacterium]|nr:DUF3034 family protein [Opitutales bacterium]